MHDHVRRLVGLEGFEVKRVIEVGGRLDLELELVARAGCCPRCGRSSVEVKQRPVARVRDLPIGARHGSGAAQAPLPLPGLRADVPRVPPRAAGAPAGDAALAAAPVRAGAGRRRARRGGAL
jgi:hypothetical protein